MSAAVLARTASPSSIDDSHRESTVSTSAASFLTAPQHPSTPPSRRSSLQAAPNPPLTREPEVVGSTSTLAFTLPSTNRSSPPQEVHIVRVLDDKVRLDASPRADHSFRKVAPSFYTQRHPSRTASIDSIPASNPPLHSAENDPQPIQHPLNAQSLKIESGVQFAALYDSPEEARSSSSTSSRQSPAFPASSRTSATTPPHVLPRRSSADTKTSFVSGQTSQSTLATRPIRLSNQSDSALVAADVSSSISSSKGLPNGTHASADGLLHPPVAISLKQSRRNTTGSSTASQPHLSSRSAAARMLAAQGTSISYSGDDRESEGELASDIQLQAEQIRRERQSKRYKAQQEADRAKAQQDAERALTRTTSLKRATSTRGDEKPLVGNLIGEGHVNYVLMYNMLTGIRVAVCLRTSLDCLLLPSP